MSVIFTGTNQGRFTSTGAAQIVQIPSGLDYMWVLNETTSYAAGAATPAGTQFYWQYGMTQGRGVVYKKTQTTNALTVGQIAANAGFTLIDSSVNIPSAAVEYTTITGAGGAFSSPKVNTSSTSNLPVTAVVGANNPAGVVRLSNSLGALQIGGIDFTVANVVVDTSFDLIYMDSIDNATTGKYRIIPFDPLFYPANRTITKIVVATFGTAKTGNPVMTSSQALVTLSVTHGYTVGQEIRFIIPTVTSTAFGMTELNGVQATIIAVGDTDADGATNTIRVDVDVSSFTAFAYPLTTDRRSTFPQIVPVGENTAQALSSNVNILGDSEVNTGYRGVLLAGGLSSPAGSAGDVIYWVAGKSFSVTNN